MAKTLSNEHYQGIGEIVVVWAKLEAHLLRALRTLSRMKMKEALVVYWQMGYRERITVLRGLVTVRFPEKADKRRQAFDMLAKRLESAYTVRNLVAHSIWFPGTNEDDIAPFSFDAKGGVLKLEGRRGDRSNFSASSFRKQALAIDRLAEDFKLFFSENFKVSFIHKKVDTLG